MPCYADGDSHGGARQSHPAAQPEKMRVSLPAVLFEAGSTCGDMVDDVFRIGRGEISMNDRFENRRVRTGKSFRILEVTRDGICSDLDEVDAIEEEREPAKPAFRAAFRSSWLSPFGGFARAHVPDLRTPAGCF